MKNNPNAQVLDRFLTPRGDFVGNRNEIAFGLQGAGSQWLCDERKVTTFKPHEIMRFNIDRDKMYRKIYFLPQIVLTAGGYDYYFNLQLSLYLNKREIITLPCEGSVDSANALKKSQIDLFSSRSDGPDTIRLYPGNRFTGSSVQWIDLTPVKLIAEADELALRVVSMGVTTTTFAGLFVWMGVLSQTHPV